MHGWVGVDTQSGFGSMQRRYWAYPAYFVAKLRRLIRAKAAVRGRNFDVQAEWQTSAPGQSSSNIFRTLGLR